MARSFLRLKQGSAPARNHEPCSLLFTPWGFTLRALLKQKTPFLVNLLTRLQQNRRDAKPKGIRDFSLSLQSISISLVLPGRNGYWGQLTSVVLQLNVLLCISIF